MRRGRQGRRDADGGWGQRKSKMRIVGERERKERERNGRMWRAGKSEGREVEEETYAEQDKGRKTNDEDIENGRR